ncbi:MAG: putative toxin-antitoxin system toxin component, PIN family [Elusimicrobiota bacterium]
MKKSRAVVDTGVLISAFVFGGVPEKAVRKVFSLCDVYVSPAMLFEYKETPKGLLTEGKINLNQFEVLIEGIATFVSKSVLVYPKDNLTICRDPKDDFILECCLTADINFLITGDKDLLELKENYLPEGLRNLRITTPSKFLEVIENE